MSESKPINMYEANERYLLFNRSALTMKPIAERQSDMTIDDIVPLDAPTLPIDDKRKATLRHVAERIVQAKESGAESIFMMGAHVIRSGMQRYIIDLMERGYITLVSMNGAGMIHDFELCVLGETGESVEKYIAEGQFGLWEETAWINDAVNRSNFLGSCLGDTIAREMYRKEYTHWNDSILAQSHRLQVDTTIHIGIGYDIICQHDNYESEIMGAQSYCDFLKFAKRIGYLPGGVIMNFGSAIMAPEIFLKALAMNRNVKEIDNFTTLVCDLVKLPDDYHSEVSKDDAAYYFRPFKTMLVRATGGDTNYVRGYHKETIPNLWQAIGEVE